VADGAPNRVRTDDNRRRPNQDQDGSRRPNQDQDDSHHRQDENRPDRGRHHHRGNREHKCRKQLQLLQML